jgi:cell wall assembly regulator SMI1
MAMATSVQQSLQTIISWMQEHSPETLAGLNSPASQADLDKMGGSFHERARM